MADPMTRDDLDEIERLEAESCALADERDDARAELKTTCRELHRAENERDEAQAKAARYLEHLRQAHPRHFTPNVLGERLCGCVEQWPCREQVDLEQAEARVLQAFTAADADGLAVMTPAELAAFVMAAIKKEASE